MRLEYNRSLFLIIIILFIIVVISVVIIRNQNIESEEDCVIDSDCIKQQVTCCPCSSGGEEKCLSKKESKLEQEKLAKECEENVICPAVYNCKETKCECEDKECIEK